MVIPNLEKDDNLCRIIWLLPKITGVKESDISHQ